MRVVIVAAAAILSQIVSTTVLLTSPPSATIAAAPSTAVHIIEHHGMSLAAATVGEERWQFSITIIWLTAAVATTAANHAFQ